MIFLINIIKWGLVIAGFYFVAMALLAIFKKKEWKKQAIFAAVAFVISFVIGLIVK